MDVVGIMDRGIYWCGNCCIPLLMEGSLQCPKCAKGVSYLATDVRPVFARERRILEFYGYGSLREDVVWRGRSYQYYINGRSVSSPRLERLRCDLIDIRKYIHDTNHYDALDERLVCQYRQQLVPNQLRLLALEDEAFQFIQHAVRRFPDRMVMVSFSGGKDSIVVSDLVCRGLGRSDILHVFGDTTLEDENTYEYVNSFQEQNPQIPFFNACAECQWYNKSRRLWPDRNLHLWA